MFLYDAIVNATPMLVAAWDAGFYSLNTDHLKAYLETWSFSKVEG